MNPLYVALLVVQGVLALFLIVLVLLHAPKGEGMGGIGGGATLFPPNAEQKPALIA